MSCTNIILLETLLTPIVEAKKLKEVYIESAHKFDIQINYAMTYSIENARESIRHCLE